MDQVSYLRIYL